MTQMASQIRSALRGGVSRVGGGGTSYHDGISYNAATGKVTIKAPGAAPVTSDLTSAFTFARNGSATFRGPSGLVEYANENLALQSQTFDDVAWPKSNCTVSANATTAPDGTLTADKIQSDATPGVDHNLGQGISIEIGRFYTWSIHVKASEQGWVRVQCGTGFAAAMWMFVNLTTGALGTVSGAVNPKVTDVGNGWFRIQFTTTIATVTTTTSVAVYLATGNDVYTHNGVLNNGVFVWGAQFQRGASVGTYLPTVAAAKYDQPRVEYASTTIGTNLLLHSQTLNTGATWPMGGWTVLANGALAPDGTQTAEVFTETTAGGVHSIDQTIAINPAQQYTFSVYAKSSQRGVVIKFRDVSDSNGVVAAYNLQTGTVSIVPGLYGSATGASGSITAVGNGWYRVSITGTLNGGFTSAALSLRGFGFGSEGYTGDGASQLTLWGAQFEPGGAATQYTPTTTTAPAYTNSPPVCLGLLMEGARTNLGLHSQDVTAAAWTGGTGLTFSANATTAPDGTLTADKLIEDGTTGEHRVRQTMTTTAGATVTASIWGKAAENPRFNLRVLDGAIPADSFSATFDLALGTVAGSGANGATTLFSASIVPYPNGWYRCIVTAKPNGTMTSCIFDVFQIDAVGFTANYTGDNASGNFVWGFQFEEGQFATSYIPTTTASIARVVDACSRTIGAEYNANAGTFVVQGRSFGQVVGARQVFAAVTDGSVANTIPLVRPGSSNDLQLRIEAASANQSAVALTLTNGAFFKAAGAWQTDIVDLALNTILGTRDTLATIPGGITTFHIGGEIGGNACNGHILELDYYPRRFTSGDMALVTG